jgi:hypothetical protein
MMKLGLGETEADGFVGFDFYFIHIGEISVLGHLEWVAPSSLTVQVFLETLLNGFTPC